MISFKYLDPAMPEARHPWNFLFFFFFLRDPINYLALKPVCIGFLSLGTKRGLTNPPAFRTLPRLPSLRRCCSRGDTPINCPRPVTDSQLSTVALGPSCPYWGRGPASFPTRSLFQEGTRGDCWAPEQTSLLGWWLWNSASSRARPAALHAQWSHPVLLTAQWSRHCHAHCTDEENAWVTQLPSGSVRTPKRQSCAPPRTRTRPTDPKQWSSPSTRFIIHVLNLYVWRIHTCKSSTGVKSMCVECV